MRRFIFGTVILLLLMACCSGIPAYGQISPYIGEVRMISGTYAPRGWMLCQGQTLLIAEHTNLFQLVGTSYGGDGQSTFKLPDLRGRVPIGDGQGPGITTNYSLGQVGGAESVAVTIAQFPAHTHSLAVDLFPGVQSSIANGVFARYRGGEPGYGDIANASMLPTALSSAGSSQPHSNLQPFLAVNYMIADSGSYPNPSGAALSKDAKEIQENFPLVGHILLVAFNFAPTGWVNCDGRLLSISSYPSLYELLGTTFGGDGITSFAVPDLRGRVPVGLDGSNTTRGQKGGEEKHTLTVAEIPQHTHALQATSAIGTAAKPIHNVPAKNAEAGLMYSGSASGATMNPAIISTAGGSQAHENRKPYAAMHYIISLSGVYPPRN